MYITHPHPCSYLGDQEASTLFVDPEVPITLDLYSRASEIGFRRSGDHIYKPKCANCNACIPMRVNAGRFRPGKTQKRILKKNRSLTFTKISNIRNDACYTLYERYINLRHNDGDMYPPSREQYDSFLQEIDGITHYYAIREEDRLLAIAVTDQLKNGLSAIYTFYEPGLEERSLGTYAILKQIELCRELGLPYLYLGFWIKDCRKMNYKTRFRPFQMYTQNRWIDVN